MKATSFKLSGFLGALIIAAGCGSKVEPAPVAAQSVAQVKTEAKSEAKAAPAPTAATNTVAAAPKAGDEHAACGDHAAKAAEGGEAGCPFDEEKKGEHEGAEACGGHGAAAVAPAKDGNALHFGQAFAITEAKPLAVVLAGAPADDAAVRVSGKIEKVCKKMGCWMVVKDGDKTARVIMKDHAFTVPLDSEGKSVNVEGTLKTKTFTAAQAKHLAEDGGEDTNKAQGETTEFILTATAVNIGG